MVKKYQEPSIKTIEDILSVEAHARKQVQMHCVASNITQRFSAKIPDEFGLTFSHGKVFYSVLENVPVTIEAYLHGEFIKYIDNDGECLDAPKTTWKSYSRKHNVFHTLVTGIVTRNL